MGAANSVPVLEAMVLVGLLGGQTIGVGGLIAGSRVSAGRRVIFALFVAAMGAATFQLVHASEHVMQLGYWIIHPDRPPWITPWAAPIAHGLARLGGPNPAALGVELLHLLGNGVFFVGLITLAALLRICAPTSRANRTTKIALWVQGIHLLEHLALTLTVALTGRPAGVSTFFGLVDPGPVVWTYRIWWHFLINLAGTWLLLQAIRQYWSDRVRLGEIRAPLSGWAPEPAHRLDRRYLIDAFVKTAGVILTAAAIMLAIHIGFVVLDANPQNVLVEFSRAVANGLVLFFRDMFVSGGPKAQVAANYGLAAGVYFVVGRVLVHFGRRE